MFNLFNRFNKFGMFQGASSFDPSLLIDYKWSTTYQSDNQMYSRSKGSSKQDLKLYSGQGLKFNGVDQGVNDVLNGLTYPYSLQVTSNGRDGYIVSSLYTNSERLYLYIVGGIYYLRLGGMVATNTLIASSSNDFISLIVEEGTYALKVNNKEVSSSFVTSGAGSVNGVRIGLDPNSVGSGSGTLKDIFIFNRTLTQTEITKYSTNPNGFFNDALVDDTCVLNMPLAEHSTDCYDYANDTWHTITNYTDSCRDEAKQLPYGSQNANYKINGLGMRTEESPYFECSELFDNYGDTGWIPSGDEDWSIELGSFYFDNTDKGLLEYIGGGFFLRNYFGNLYLYAPSGRFNIGGLRFKEVNSIIITNSNNITSLYIDGLKKTPTTTTIDIFKNFSIILLNFTHHKLKVHQKALTQEEVTTAYNKALQKGLLDD